MIGSSLLLHRDGSPKEKTQTCTIKKESDKGKVKQFIKLLKEGPAGSSSYNNFSSYEDETEEEDAPLPRRKSKYELFLKHRVREAQIQSYNEEIQRESTRSSSRSCSSSCFSSTSSLNSLKRVRFADTVDSAF
ncbi:uncharacterized protein CYBJADRAFT_174797 [Cyberlindnera jadinii NRRL Y-1542]|uniref:Uncharacterized protein n=1 Tax=Cyberlindnera jadinii (strain ATCC 18201 / CBS 1600 / BCRC 20928 / JCM 3617 / NBRC 0987 / NRRL Y-1542) TaxID=983966 RepID=A0A1E4RWZ4_CYBJN|nr:hypothetical protein CYBJADRAFT_174797 [Cyberlindnera jadinii NRRL Y-1542]ODV71793.1 hypothetical protein CYBJADRAFT_174797 [Cyberlindnera jadinii NRRL Y-1542]